MTINHNLTAKAGEIVILQKNMRDLQSQLAAAHKRIYELTKDKNVAKEELVNERQLLVELEAKLSQKQFETTDLIEEQIEDWPDVIDSRPEKRYKSKSGEWD